MKDEIEVERIDTHHPLYGAESALRLHVLLDPVGYSVERFHKEFPGVDDTAEHFVVTRGGSVVGCALLIVEGDAGKLMQMAVARALRGGGIGSELLAAIERRAFGELGLRGLYCHARAEAVGFYSRRGWRRVGAPFDEVGIRHWRMEKVGGSLAAGPAAG